MEQPPSKRSKRLNQMIGKKPNENEIKKRKIPSAPKTINVKSADAVNVKLKFEKDGKKKKIEKDVQPKIKSKKKSGQSEVKDINEKQDQNSSGHDEEAGKVEVAEGDDESLISEGEVRTNEDPLDVANPRDVEPRSAARNIEPKKARADGKKSKLVKSKLVKPTRSQNTDEKKKKTTDFQPKVAAVKIKPKKKTGQSEVKETNEKQDQNSISHDVEIPGKVEATDGKDDECLRSGDEVSSNEDSLDVANASDVEPKIARNVNPKTAAGKDDVKVVDKAGMDEVKPSDENEMELDSDDDSDLSDAPQNNGRVLKVMSRIENKLDNWVSQGVNEKRMFAIVLQMPFDLVENINQYNLDLLDVDLFLKFVKYFECVGGNSDGKIVCNILHQIATPDLLSHFDWQISSEKSFQALKNIVKLIHTAAKGKCSEKFDMSVCGEVIKNVLRNARGGVYKK